MCAFELITAAIQSMPFIGVVSVIPPDGTCAILDAILGQLMVHVLKGTEASTITSTHIHDRVCHHVHNSHAHGYMCPDSQCGTVVDMKLANSQIRGLIFLPNSFSVN